MLHWPFTDWQELRIVPPLFGKIQVVAIRAFAQKPKESLKFLAIRFEELNDVR